MSKFILRGLLICLVSLAVIVAACACTRAKPERAKIAPGPEAGAAAPSATVTDGLGADDVVLPVVSGEGESTTRGEGYPEPATATSTLLVPPPTTQPTASPVQATPTLPVPAATPLPITDVTYIVKTGDTLLSIAAAHNTTKQAIINKNGLTNPDLIRVGQKLSVPVGYSPTPAAAPAIEPEPAVRTHRVQPGESLSAIAAKYGLTSAVLAQANGLANPNLIYVGQRLIIPQ